jgi:hypothetical protein
VLWGSSHGWSQGSRLSTNPPARCPRHQITSAFCQGVLCLPHDFVCLHHRCICRGPGVVGEQPRLEPGQSFEYQSACPLFTSSANLSFLPRNTCCAFLKTCACIIAASAGVLVLWERLNQASPLSINHSALVLSLVVCLHCCVCRGPGVVGEQPLLEPCQAYEYQFACLLSTSSVDLSLLPHNTCCAFLKTLCACIIAASAGALVLWESCHGWSQGSRLSTNQPARCSRHQLTSASCPPTRAVPSFVPAWLYLQGPWCCGRAAET